MASVGKPITLSFKNKEDAARFAFEALMTYEDDKTLQLTIVMTPERYEGCCAITVITGSSQLLKKTLSLYEEF